MNVPSSGTPKVSVCVITYNQEPYIAQCLQSLVDQVTDFEFEVIVGEDCSTDGTRAVVREYAERYPHIIRPIYQEKNIGAGVHNFLTVHGAARGEYIAHVDGDDYALPGKLQAQADVLDADPGCNIVFHRMLLLYQDGRLEEGPLLNAPDVASLRFDRGDIIQFMAIGPHSSKMYRKSHRDYPRPPGFDVTDYFANVEQVGDGYARFTGHENLGVYRIMGNGIAAGGVRPRKALADTFVHFTARFPRYRLQANTAALTYLIADLKNRRPTWRLFLGAWLRTFHPLSPVCLLRSLGFINKLKKSH
jgi:glycosyltransferase involved in cell wall biosynthesis